MLSDQQKFINSNRQTWDRYTKIHAASDFYDLNSFIEGQQTIHSTEMEELGDLKDKSLLHLQCHFGQDTLSLERLGAICTGVDISGESIEQAKKLASQLKLKSKFIRSDVYELNANLKETFDIVYTSYGVLFWLPDLNKWAQMVAERLKSGGRFYLIEFHPFLDVIDESFSFFKYPYFPQKGSGPIEFKEKGTYADPQADIESTTYGWPHSLGEVLTALTKAGLIISFMHEFAFSHYAIFENMIEFSPGKFHHENLKGTIPYMYSIMAMKP